MAQNRSQNGGYGDTHQQEDDEFEQGQRRTPLGGTALVPLAGPSLAHDVLAGAQETFCDRLEGLERGETSGASHETPSRPEVIRRSRPRG